MRRARNKASKKSAGSVQPQKHGTRMVSRKDGRAKIASKSAVDRSLKRNIERHREVLHELAKW